MPDNGEIPFPNDGSHEIVQSERLRQHRRRRTHTPDVRHDYGLLAGLARHLRHGPGLPLRDPRSPAEALHALGLLEVEFQVLLTRLLRAIGDKDLFVIEELLQLRHGQSGER